jgi:hypothetical protein
MNIFKFILSSSQLGLTEGDNAKIDLTPGAKTTGLIVKKLFFS